MKRSYLAGRSFRCLLDANHAAIDWVLDHGGVRVHGTTQEIPLHVFEARERPALIALPSAPFDLVEWKQAKLHPDCHVVFGRSYYSAPHPFIGERLWLRATTPCRRERRSRPARPRRPPDRHHRRELPDTRHPQARGREEGRSGHEGRRVVAFVPHVLCEGTIMVMVRWREASRTWRIPDE